MSQSSSLFYLVSSPGYDLGEYLFTFLYLLLSKMYEVIVDMQNEWFLFVCSNTVLIALEFVRVAVLIEDTSAPMAVMQEGCIISTIIDTLSSHFFGDLSISRDLVATIIAA